MTDLTQCETGVVQRREPGKLGIRCPSCTRLGSRVVDKRPQHGYYRRRRRCDHCGFKFTTKERLAFDTNKTCLADAPEQVQATGAT